MEANKKLTWNMALTGILAGAQIALANNLVTSPKAVQWMIAGATAIKTGQLLWSHFTVPNGAISVDAADELKLVNSVQGKLIESLSPVVSAELTKRLTKIGDVQDVPVQAELAGRQVDNNHPLE